MINLFSSISHSPNRFVDCQKMHRHIFFIINNKSTFFQAEMSNIPQFQILIHEKFLILIIIFLVINWISLLCEDVKKLKCTMMGSLYSFFGVSFCFCHFQTINWLLKKIIDILTDNENNSYKPKSLNKSLSFSISWRKSTNFFTFESRFLAFLLEKG